MRITLCAGNDAVAERMVFREAKVIRTSFIQEDECAGRDSVPGMRRNQIKSGLEVRSKRWRFLSSVTCVVSHKRHPSKRPTRQNTNGYLLESRRLNSVDRKSVQKIVTTIGGWPGTRLFPIRSGEGP